MAVLFTITHAQTRMQIKTSIHVWINNAHKTCNVQTNAMLGSFVPFRNSTLINFTNCFLLNPRCSTAVVYYYYIRTAHIPLYHHTLTYTIIITKACCVQTCIMGMNGCSWTEEGGSRCNGRRGSHTSPGGFRQSIASSTQTHTRMNICTHEHTQTYPTN